MKAESLVFEVNKIVKSKTGETLDDFVFDSEALIKRVNDEIVQPILKKFEKKETVTPPIHPIPAHPSRLIDPSYMDNRGGFHPVPDPLRDIGRGDLNPFGLGGGMIFRPERPGGLPHPGLG